MSNLPGSILLIALFAGIILFIIYFGGLGKRPRHVLLASLAGRWNGRVVEGGLLGRDSLEIKIAGVEGEVTFGESWTRLRFDWPSDRRLRVVPEGMASRLRRLFGGSDIRLDDHPFDDWYWVESSHPTWARELLDPAVRRALVRIRMHPGAPESLDATLDIGPAGIALGVAFVLVDNAGTLGSFVEAGISILQKALGLREAAGVAVEPVRLRTGSTCPVCGQAVADEALPCPTCRTPHHLDCWKYFGGCAIFGCRARMRRGRA